jgi:hypothetical protein
MLLTTTRPDGLLDLVSYCSQVGQGSEEYRNASRWMVKGEC